MVAGGGRSGSGWLAQPRIDGAVQGDYLADLATLEQQERLINWACSPRTAA